MLFDEVTSLYVPVLGAATAALAFIEVLMFIILFCCCWCSFLSCRVSQFFLPHESFYKPSSLSDCVSMSYISPSFLLLVTIHGELFFFLVSTPNVFTVWAVVEVCPVFLPSDFPFSLRWYDFYRRTLVLLPLIISHAHHVPTSFCLLTHVGFTSNIVTYDVLGSHRKWKD